MDRTNEYLYEHLESDETPLADLLIGDYVADDQPVNLEDVSTSSTRAADQPSERVAYLVLLEAGTQEFY